MVSLGKGTNHGHLTMRRPGPLAGRRPAGSRRREALGCPLMSKLTAGRAWRAQTVAIPDPGALHRYLADPGDLAWLRRGDGVVGLGVAERVEVADAEEADAWWAETGADIEHETELIGGWGVGPLAFGSFTFDPANTASRSVLIVPRVIIGRRGGRSWLTTLRRSDAPDPGPTPPPSSAPSPASAPDAPGAVGFTSAGVGRDGWTDLVDRVVHLLGDDDNGLAKVVLARSVLARAERPIDPRWLVDRLADRYPTCWTFHVDGLVGASPELLIRSEGGLATSRVLAGTIRRHHPAADDLLAVALSESAKELVEHELAVASVAESLAPYCSGMNVPESPFVLRLPNVMHLASDVTAVTRAFVTSLQLCAQLHPSAAVCGTPRGEALATIAALERLDRGRYAGPVGWIDTNGDGEWAIALRCGLLDAADPREMALYAGCGIVSRSDPAAELTETDAKLRPMIEALSVTAAES